MENEKEKTYISTNLKHLRSINNKSLNDVASICDKTDVAVHYWENGTREPNAVDIAKLSNYYNITVDDLLLKDLRFDNAEFAKLDSNVTKIPVLGVIKAGTPIEAQEDVIEYIDIPKMWTRGGKRFYGLKIKGDSMYPKYQTNDTVIFEKCEDIYEADNKDCAVLVNGFDATFKKIKLNQNGITLIPYNQENSDGFETTYYDSQQVQDLPIKIIGIAREKRTRL